MNRVTKDYTTLVNQLCEALGPNYALEDFQPAIECDVQFQIPEPLGGTFTVCLRHRRWCPGGSFHASSWSANGESFGIKLENPERYRGRGWPRKLAEDIKQAMLNWAEEVISNQPGLLRGAEPDVVRGLFR